MGQNYENKSKEKGYQDILIYKVNMLIYVLPFCSNPVILELLSKILTTRKEEQLMCHWHLIVDPRQVWADSRSILDVMIFLGKL